MQITFEDHVYTIDTISDNLYTNLVTMAALWPNWKSHVSNYPTRIPEIRRFQAKLLAAPVTPDFTCWDKAILFYFATIRIIVSKLIKHEGYTPNHQFDYIIRLASQPQFTKAAPITCSIATFVSQSYLYWLKQRVPDTQSTIYRTANPHYAKKTYLAQRQAYLTTMTTTTTKTLMAKIHDEIEMHNITRRDLYEQPHCNIQTSHVVKLSSAHNNRAYRKTIKHQLLNTFYQLPPLRLPWPTEHLIDDPAPIADTVEHIMPTLIHGQLTEIPTDNHGEQLFSILDGFKRPSVKPDVSPLLDCKSYHIAKSNKPNNIYRDIFLNRPSTYHTRQQIRACLNKIAIRRYANVPNMLTTSNQRLAQTNIMLDQLTTYILPPEQKELNHWQLKTQQMLTTFVTKMVQTETD